VVQLSTTISSLAFLLSFWLCSEINHLPSNRSIKEVFVDEWWKDKTKPTCCLQSSMLFRRQWGPASLDDGRVAMDNGSDRRSISRVVYFINAHWQKISMMQAPNSKYTKDQFNGKSFRSTSTNSCINNRLASRQYILWTILIQMLFLLRRSVARFVVLQLFS